MKHDTSPRPSPNSPMYLLGLVVGSIAFVFGAVAALLLYIGGGRDLAIVGVVVGVIVFAGLYQLLLRLRERDGSEP